MRISQLQSLTEDELGLLLYVYNVLEPIRPPIELNPKLLLFLRHDMLISKMKSIEPKLKPENKPLLDGLIAKLNTTWVEELTTNANTQSIESEEPEFHI